MEILELRRQVLGHPIVVTAVPCGRDLSVTVRGGQAPHIGSVTTAHPLPQGTAVESWVGPGHRDDVVGERFARVLAERTQATVSVACGIHYDRPTREDLSAIVSACDGLLEEVCAHLPL